MNMMKNILNTDCIMSQREYRPSKENLIADAKFQFKKEIILAGVHHTDMIFGAEERKTLPLNQMRTQKL